MHMVLSVLDSFSSMECIFYNKDLFLCFLKPKGLPKTSFDSEFHLRIREKKRRRERERNENCKANMNIQNFHKL